MGWKPGGVIVGKPGGVIVEKDAPKVGERSPYDWSFFCYACGPVIVRDGAGSHPDEGQRRSAMAPHLGHSSKDFPWYKIKPHWEPHEEDVPAPKFFTVNGVVHRADGRPTVEQRVMRIERIVEMLMVDSVRARRRWWHRR